MFHPLLPFSRPTVTLTDPALVQKLLEQDKVGSTTKGKVYRLVRPLIGDGLLAAAGVEHARQRRTAELGFKLEALELTATTAATLMRTRYAPYVDARGASDVDVYELMLKLTLDVLGEVAFGADFNGLETGGLYEAFETVIFTLTVRTGQLPGAQFLPTAANRKFDASLRQLDDAVLSIVQARMSQRDRGDVTDTPRNDLLSAMLALDERGEPVMSLAEICDNVKTFLFAGHDTTAAALTWWAPSELLASPSELLVSPSDEKVANRDIRVWHGVRRTAYDRKWSLND